MPTEKLKRIITNILALRYFVISTILHVLLLIFLFSIVVYEATQRTQEFLPVGLISGDGFGGGEPPPPPPSSASEATDAQADGVVPSQALQLNELLLVEGGVSSFSLPISISVAPTSDPSHAAAASSGTISAGVSGFKGMSNLRASQIRKFTDAWFGGNRPSGGRIGTRGPPIEFPIYVGRTTAPGSGAFVRVNQNGIVVAGSIPNLAEMIRYQSKGRVTPRIQGEIIPLSSQQIFEKKPPFIFITGRGDFRLTNTEVNNLRDYLIMGGCIWGDAAVPGRGSRFDIAFRREMRRVVGEATDFTPIPPNHPIYKGEFVQLSGPPAGINFLKNPVEVLKIDDIEAVIYTTNGYGAMWQVMLQERDFSQIDRSVMHPMEYDFWLRRKTIFRNVSEESLLATYQFGLNLVAYLLIRFEDAIRFAR